MARPSQVVGGLAFAALTVAVVGSGFAAQYPAEYGLPLQEWVDDAERWVTLHRRDHLLFTMVFQPVTAGVSFVLAEVHAWLDALGWAGVLLVTGVTAWVIGGWRLTSVAVGALALIGLIGVWTDAMRTLAMMSTAVGIALLVGFPLGVAAGRSQRLDSALRPLLDAFQTTPAYVYLLPLALLFTIGDPAAVVATVVYALPPTVRLTALGIRTAPAAQVEVSRAMGATSWQRLRTAELPAAMPSIRVGINQTIMMALAMVVIGSLIGGTGLGRGVLRGLQRLDVGQALEAGVAIVLLAVVMDRMTSAVGARRVRRPARWRALGLVGGAFALGVGIGQLRFARGVPGSGSLSFAAPVNTGLDQLQSTVMPLTRVVSELLVVYGLEPLRAALLLAPWWVLTGCVAIAAWRLVGPGFAAYTVAAFTITGAVGMWPQAMNTASQVAVATALAVAIGLPLGVAAGLSDLVDKGLRPVLDTLQTMPAFVYLIPVVALFQIGRVPGVIATVVYAVPPAVRLTSAGLRGVPTETVEAARSAGATTWQVLRTVLLPSAKPQILLGVNQTTMMALASIVIAGLIGAGGLGIEAVRGLTRAEHGLGITAGLVIVLLGIVLDRLTQALGAHDEAARATVKTG